MSILFQSHQNDCQIAVEPMEWIDGVQYTQTYFNALYGEMVDRLTKTKSFSTKSLIFISIKCFSPILPCVSIFYQFFFLLHFQMTDPWSQLKYWLHAYFSVANLSCNDAIFIGLGKHQHWLILEKPKSMWHIVGTIAIRCHIGGRWSSTQSTLLFLFWLFFSFSLNLLHNAF